MADLQVTGVGSRRKGVDRTERHFSLEGAVVVTSHGYGSGFGHRQAGQGATGPWVEHEAPQPWRRDRRPEAEEQNQKQRGRERKRGTTVALLGSAFGEGGLILLGHNPPDSFLFFGPICFWALLFFGPNYLTRKIKSHLFEPEIFFVIWTDFIFPGLKLFQIWVIEYLIPCPYKFVFGFKS